MRALSIAMRNWADKLVEIIDSIRVDKCPDCLGHIVRLPTKSFVSYRCEGCGVEFDL